MGGDDVPVEATVFGRPGFSSQDVQCGYSSHVGGIYILNYIPETTRSDQGSGLEYCPIAKA